MFYVRGRGVPEKISFLSFLRQDMDGMGVGLEY